MNRIILYAIETVLCSGLFLALYRLLIQRKAGYTFCRRYLVVTLILATVIPAFDVPVYVEKAAPAEAVQPAPEAAVQTSQIPQIIQTSRTVQEIAPSAPASDRNVVAPSFRMNWNALVIAVYLAGLLFSLALMLRSYITIARLKRGSRLSREDGYELAQNDDVESPFSFGKTIFMGRVSSDSELRQILSHEMSHIGHHHTQEKLLMSAIRSCLWFNPFAWLQERHLEEVQEWQADADVLAHGFNVDDYRNTILKTLLGVNPAATSGLNGSFTKKRMQQMGTEENHGHAAMVSLAAIALTAVCFCLFSLNVQARPV
ncbi:MAG: M56 family metallopeptidase, partial [Bacteroidaceae bacterium]|nr:M56 family metallopeptidase [Bacteroidaceae bacterium]